MTRTQRRTEPGEHSLARVSRARHITLDLATEVHQDRPGPSFWDRAGGVPGPLRMAAKPRSAHISQRLLSVGCAPMSHSYNQPSGEKQETQPCRAGFLWHEQRGSYGVQDVHNHRSRRLSRRHEREVREKWLRATRVRPAGRLPRPQARS